MYASRMTSQNTGRSRSSSAGSTTWMPVNIRSVTRPSGGRGERASRMPTTRPVSSVEIAPQRRASGSSRSSIVATAPPARRARAERREIEIGDDLCVHDQHRPRAEARAREGEAAARAEEPSSTEYSRPTPWADGAQRLAQEIAVVEDVDDGAREPGARARREAEGDRGIAADGHEGLGQRRAERTEARRPPRPREA